MAGATRNVLWIMCDQLRHDYLGCAGHPHIKTPAIDRLAAEGVRFTRAYAQSTICGASRASAYTGRYVRGHGASGNEVPIAAGAAALGYHLADIGADAVLIGKTHMRADAEGLRRLNLDPASGPAARSAEAGFTVFERHDGLHPDGDYDPSPRYSSYLREQGFDADNPWEAYANAAEAPDGSIVSGWLMENAHLPARVPAEHSETAWITNRAMDFMAERGAGGRAWCAHLSYIKPHWPYLAPAPYHAAYDESHIVPPVRSEAERADPHPLYSAFLEERYSRAFSKDEVRNRVIPAYMGLIQEVDDNLARLFAFMREEGLMDNTMIIFTSDHGDYLGDHWLGEKYLFHDASVRIPLLVRDPRPEADTARGSKCAELTEMIDILPTIIDYMAGGEASASKAHCLDGRTLTPLLEGRSPAARRDAVFSEYDFAYDAARVKLGAPVDDSCATMVFDGRWKYVHVPGHPPLLYDLNEDPDELKDLGRSPDFAPVIERMRERMFEWCRRQFNRTTVSHTDIQRANTMARVYDHVIDHNIYIGYWDRSDIAAEEKKRGNFSPPPV
ncbi:MAG: sulfatase-like hydrolase/transferase [Rhodospirillales bacterium]